MITWFLVFEVFNHVIITHIFAPRGALQLSMGEKLSRDVSGLINKNKNYTPYYIYHITITLVIFLLL
jgi:hypothetical protein